MRLRLLLASIACLALIVPVASQSAEIPDEQLSVPLPPEENVGGYSGVYYDDQRTLQRAFYFVEAGSKDSSRLNTYVTCKSALDEPCKSNENLFFETPLPPCTDSRLKDCVLSLEAKLSDKSFVQGVSIETITAATDEVGDEASQARYFTPFTGDASRNIPDSGYPSIWKFPGVTHQGGDEFLLVPKVNAEFYNTQGNTAVNLDVGLFPISKIQGFVKGCFLQTRKVCVQRWPFPKDISYRLRFKSGNQIVGWFYGRLTEPAISSEKLSDGQTLISVEGSPVVVPIVAAWSKNTDLPKVLDDLIEREFVERGYQFGGTCYYSGCRSKNRADQVVMDERNPSFNRGDYFQRYLLWLDVVKDKAYANKSTWSFRSLDYYAQYEKCMGKSGVAGLVTTNSNAYIATPPVFEKEELTYKVASPHYDSKGNVQIGTYDLAIRSDVARCIYGFNDAPVNATLNVVYDDGEVVNATTVVGEKNGWLYLSAKGFTYSSPTVKVKLTQEKETPQENVNSTSANEPTKSAFKRTVTCTKGSKVNKISGMKPKCPKGYKKA